MGINSTPAPDGATTFTNNDAAILAAWDRRAAAFAILQALPDNPRGDGETPERHAQWAIIDAAEAEIRSSVATTARGAAIQLRSEERRVGKECGSACRSRCARYHNKK